MCVWGGLGEWGGVGVCFGVGWGASVVGKSRCPGNGDQLVCTVCPSTAPLLAARAHVVHAVHGLLLRVVGVEVHAVDLGLDLQRAGGCRGWMVAMEPFEPGPAALNESRLLNCPGL